MRLLYIFLLITSIFCLGIIIYVIIRKSRPGPGPSYYLRDNFELSDTPGLTDTPIGYYLQQDSDFSTNYILMKSGSPDYKTMCGSVDELVGRGKAGGGSAGRNGEFSCDCRIWGGGRRVEERWRGEAKAGG